MITVDAAAESAIRRVGARLSSGSAWLAARVMAQRDRPDLYFMQRCPLDERPDLAAIRALDCRRSAGGRVSHHPTEDKRDRAAPVTFSTKGFKGGLAPAADRRRT